MSSKLFKFEAKSKNAIHEIVLYGEIGENFWGDGISAKAFSDMLAKIPATEELHIRVNSPGGSVFDGMAIYERIKQHRGKKKIFIDGLAASIASVIILAGDEIIAGEGSVIMLHKPMIFSGGNANDLEKAIQVLDKIENQMIGIYARRSGMKRDEIESILENETWYTAEEAKEKKLVDTINALSDDLKIAAYSSVEKCNWFKNKPDVKAMKDAEIKKRISEVKNKVSGFLAR